MNTPARIARALQALEATVYEEIARLVAARAEPADIDALSSLLRSVKSLGQISLPREAAGDRPVPPLRVSTRAGRAGKAELKQAAEHRLSDDAPIEFSNAGDALVKKGLRKAGAGHYLQRVPWGTVLRIAETIDSRYGPRPFHPVSLSREARAPAYQTYAVLNLLTLRGYLGSPKRGSFSKQKDVQLASMLDALRTELPRFISEVESEVVPTNSRG